LAIQVASRTLRAGYQLSTRQVFEYQTIAELAKHVKQVESAQRQDQYQDRYIVGQQPLLPIQRAFLYDGDIDQHYFNQALRIQLPKGVTDELLKSALIAVYQRHDVFRLNFKKAENNWLGHYDESNETNYKACLTVQKKGDDFDQLIDLAHRSFDLAKTPLSHVVLSLESEHRREMVWIIHHLIIDGVSWRILLQDLSLALNQLHQGQSIHLGVKSSAYQSWGAWLQQYSQSDVLLAERDYWLDIVKSPVPRLKADQPVNVEDNIRENSRTVTVTLNTEISQALLQQANRCYHTQINDLLLTALLLTMTEWQNSQAIRIELEGHGREAINDEFDLNETVGWFTTTFPVVLQRADGEIDAQIKTVKEYLRAIPNKGLGYGVLRYLSRDNDLISTTEALDIVFNYLGQFDGDESGIEDHNAASVLTGSFEKTGNWVSQKRQRSHRLSISGLVSNGQLQLEWDYNHLEYHASTIQLLADNYINNLTAIVEHCLDAPSAYTPSDFPLAQINAQQLNQLRTDYPTIADLYPCTPMQQGMLFHSQMQPDSGVYITQLILSFGTIDREHFQRSWQQLVERHAMLRTAFVHLDQGKPLQLVQSQVELPWQTRDWRTLSAEAYQEQWHSLLASERADFNLGQAPLMRLMLVQEADDRHHLIWTHHHALLDGWGVPVLFKDLEAFYCANVQGSSITQSPVAPYRRYIQWLQQQSEQVAKTYWQDYLKGFTEPTLLSDPQAISYQRHEPKQNIVEEHLLTLDSAITEQLQQVARHAKVTLNTVFQGAWGILLNRYCGSNDVVFGVTRSGRPEEVVGVEEMVGLFINSVPLRLCIPSDQQSVGQWLQTIHQSQIALDQYGYASLVDIQGWSEVEAGQKLFNSLVVFENYPIEDRWRDGDVDNATQAFTFNGISAIEQTNFPITVAIIPGKQIQIKVLFNSVELSKAFVEHLTVSFNILLESLTKDINQCVNDLSLLSTETKNKLLYQWNDTFRQYPADTSIAELFEKQVADNNNKVAIILGEEQLTYAELNAKANQLAHYLIEQGTTTGDLVGIYLNRSIDLIVSMLAILKAGAAYVPLDPQYPAERLAYMLADTDLNLIISHTELVNQLPLNQQVAICLDDFALQTELAKLSSDLIISLSNKPKKLLAYVMYTSGSTGQPKGVNATQKGVIRLVTNNSSLPLSPGTVMLQCASVTFDAATFEVWGALLNGGQLVLYKEPLIDPLTLAKTINEFNINTLWLTAGLFDQFVANCSHSLPSLQYLLTGGDVVNPVSVAEFYKRHPQLTIINGYGPTENVTFTCCYKIPRDWPTHQRIPIGKPISNTTVYVLDAQLNPVPVGVTGELFTGGDGVANGYLNQDELTASRFVTNPFSKDKNAKLYRTGDLVRWLPDGNIAFEGRADQQVKLRGFRIELGEIESTLNHCAEVSESSVLIHNGRQHQDKRIVAYVVLSHGVESSKTEITTDIQIKLKEQLPSYMVPSTIMIVPEIPLTANGKVDRRALPEPDIISEYYVAPSTVTEVALAGIWKAILGSAHAISREASFFELGGHSLLAMQLVAAVRKQFAIEIAINQIFEYAILCDQAKLIDQFISQQKTCLPEIQANTRQDLSQLSYAQQRLWFIDQMEGGSAHYNMPLAFRLKGDVNLEALNKALATVIARHEVLRTSFINKSGEVYQHIQAMPENWQLQLKDLQGVDKDMQEKMLSALQQEEADKPFNLSTDLLLRGLLIKLDTTDVVLLLTMHHIASDGWSLGILMDEISQLYHGINNNKAVNLPELSIQYRDYALWQRSAQVSQLLDTQLSFWQKQLAGLPAVHNLPLDKPRPVTQQYRGQWHYLQLNSQVTEQFKQLCQQQGVTLFMGLHAAFSVLLARYSGDNDIVVGTPIANREQHRLAELIGFFVNTLVLRLDLDDNPSYLQLLEQAKTTALQAYAHQQVPFEQLVEVLQPARDLSYHPLFQVMLVLNSRQQTMQLEDICCTPMTLTTSRAQFDLMLTVEDQEDNLALAWEYNTDLFHAETIEQMSVQFNRLLESIIQTPEQPVLSLSLLTDVAASQVLTDWNNTAAGFPDNSCIHQLFEKQVKQSPEAVAIQFEQQTLTYQAFNERANQLANYLVQFGVKPDQLVGICLERSIDMVVAIIAVLKAGGAYVPLDPSYPAERLAYMLEDSQASVLISDSHLVSKLNLSADQFLCVDDEYVQQQLAQQSVVNLDTQHIGVTATHLAYVIYTSGSTGKPKGVMNQHRGLVNRIHWMQKQFGLQSTDNVLQKTPFGFDVSIWEYCWPLVTGASVVMARPEGHKDVDYLLDTIEQAGITVMHFVPPMLATFIADGRYQHRIPSLRLVVCSGEALAVDVQNRFLANHHAELYNLYGPTEAAIDVSCWQCQPNFMGRSVPIGKPIDNTQLYVLDNQLKPVPVGVVGELFIGGVGLARGYFNRDELTAERFLPDPFAKEDAGQESKIYRTGDLARWLPDGNIEYLGRIDHQVKLRGFRIELGEIETQLGNISGVSSCVVIAREDQPGDKRLVAYIVPTAQSKVPTAQENNPAKEEAEWIASLQQTLAEQLPDYMVPVGWAVLDALPLTPNGKVDRKALPAPKLQTTSHYVAPETSTETVLASLWLELLNTEEPVGRNANFFALGGHSLLAIRLVAELRNRFNKDINVRSIFTHPTLASFAQFIDNALADESQAPPITQVDRQAQLPLSYAQQRLWFLAQLEGENSLYNMPLAIQLVGVLNVTALNQALNQLISRHESLRTCFAVEGGEAYQAIQAAPEVFSLTQVDLQQTGAALQAEQLAQLRLSEAERPFDLQQGLMIRGQLVILAPEKHVLLLTLHHIAGDAVSLDILMHELDSLYQAYCQAETDSLPALPIQYADYAVWQRNWLQGEVLQKQLQYWQTQLMDIPDVHSLPLDIPRPKEQSYTGEVYQQAVPTKLTVAFRDFCQAQGVTLFMGLQAAFALLLSRYSGETDIVLGTPVANREQLEIEALIGFFVNTLVLRTDLSGNPSFTELLARCRETALDAYAHQQVPFEQLVEVLQPNRHLSHHPLFQIMLAVQTQDVTQQQLGDLVIEALAETSPTAKFDLTLNVLDNQADGQLAFYWEYCTDLFAADTITRMSQHLLNLLERIIQQPEQAIQQLSMLTSAEQQALLAQGQAVAQGQALTQGRNARQCAMTQCIHEQVEQQFALTPEATALVLGADSLSYAELNEQANQLAHWLVEQGVGPDVLVGMCLERSMAMIVTILAVHKAGGGYVPLDVSYPVDRLNYMVSDSGCQLIITEQAQQAKLASVDADSKYWDDPAFQATLAAQPVTNLPVTVTGVTPQHLAYVIYTSGSTGKPKGVMIEHQALVSHIQSIIQAYGITAKDRVLQFSNIGFDAAVEQVFEALTTGASLYIRPAELWTSAEFVSWLQANPITITEFPPMYAKALLEPVLGDTAFWQATSLSRLVVSGDVLPPDFAEGWLTGPAQQHCQLINNYGPTETTISSTLYWLGAGGTDQAVSGGVSVPIGSATLDTEVYVVDSQQQLVPVGVPGELLIGGIGLARGYLNRPELTAEKFIAHPFSADAGARVYRTGDLVRWLANGELEFFGRLDTQVKLRGFRIELGEIETALRQQDAVHDAVVLVREDEPGDKQLVAYVVPTNAEAASTDQTLLIDSLRQVLQEQLPDFMIPAAWVVLAAFPVNANGKLDRKALPVPEYAAGDDYVVPTTETEAQLALIWQEVLELNNPVSAHANFFKLGGHSLLAVRLVAKIREHFGAELSIKQVFISATLASMAKEIANLAGDQTLAIKPADRSASLPLSFAQQRLWFLQQLEGGASYNMPGVFKLTGDLDKQALSQALSTIVARHEVLRTCYIEKNGQSYQLIQAAPSVLPLATVDLKALTATQRESQLNALMNAEAETPFDLNHDLMLRCQLVELTDSEHVLLLTMHHIASDGWSTDLLFNELTTLYQAYCQGLSNPLPSLAIQYADYAVWQRNWLQGEVLQKQLQYWQTQLMDIPDVHSLPLDMPRPKEQSYAGEVYQQAVPTKLTVAFRDFCQAQGVTLFMGLQAAFALLLSRYSGETDIVLGTPVANREQLEIEALIGFFVNTLVLRTDLSGNPSFTELLARCRETALDAYAHQQVPFEQLVEVLQPNRHLSHHPLFQVMLAVQTQDVTQQQLGDLVIEALAETSPTAKFDLTLNVLDSQADGQLAFYWEYCTDLFAADTITRMSQHLLNLLERIIQQPEQAIQQLSMLTSAEQQALLAQGQAVVQGQALTQGRDARQCAMTQCIHEQVEQQVALTPEATALILGADSLSYAELNEQANQLAHWLVEQGVGPDVLVGMCLERSMAMIVTILAVHKAGGGYVPLDVSYPVDRLNYMVSDSGCQLIITEQAQQAKLASVDADSKYWDDPAFQATLAAQPVTNLPVTVTGVTPQHLAYVIYTSGSTGKPKGVMIEHQALVSHIQSIIQAYGITAKDRVLQFSNIGFDAAVEQVFEALTTGASLYIRPAELWTSAEFVSWLQANPITITEFPPMYAKALLEPVLGDTAFWQATSLSRLVVSGDVLPPDFAEGWLTGPAQQHCQLINNYGPTETTISSTLYWLGAGGTDQAVSGGVSVPIGSATLDTEVYVVDSQQQLVPVGVPGELLIGGIGLARGYLNRPELTAEKFIAHPFSADAGARVYRTGDLVRWLANGELEFFGRLDTQVKLRGFRIELGEIETALRQQDAVHDAVVLVREDEPGDKQLVAYVVPTNAEAASTDQTLLIDSLRQVLQEQLPDFMIPAAWVVLAAFPVNANGKLDRKALPVPEYAAGDDYVVPTTETEAQLALIWQEVLELNNPVSAHANFFKLGGHSLLAIQVLARIKDMFGKALSVKCLFTVPVLCDLAKHIDAEATQSNIEQSSADMALTKIEPQLRPQHIPLSYAQQRLWFIHQMEGGSQQYHMPASLKLIGLTRLNSLNAALTLLVERHEVLRTTYHNDAKGIAYQKVNSAPEVFPLAEVDLSGLSAVEQTQKVTDYQQAFIDKGFDLSEDLMLRVACLKLSEQESVLLLVMHHIASDGWSADVLITELSQCYNALCSGDKPQLAPLPLQYADYAIWQREWLQGDHLDAHMAYWRQQLSGAPDIHSIPLDKPRPAVQVYTGDVVETQLGSQLTKRFIGLCQQQGATLFMGLNTALSLLLSRYSGDQDILIGTPVANRDQLELSALVGFFVNNLVIRTQVVPNNTFVELLAQTRATALEAYEHQQVSFEHLVEAIQPSRHLSHHPLFQVMLAVQNTPAGKLELNDVAWQSMPANTTVTAFDLTLNVEETSQGLALSWEYNTRLFEKATIARMAEHFAVLLESIVDAPFVPGYQLQCLGIEAQQQLLTQGHTPLTEAHVDVQALCIQQLFEQQADAQPDAVALVFEQQTVSYAELNSRANQLAHFLIAQGVKPDSLVGVCCDRSVDLIIALLGILKAGGAYVPLDPTYPVERLSYMISNSELSLVITQQHLVQQLPSEQVLLELLILDQVDMAEQLRRYSEDNIAPATIGLKPDHLAYVIYTSGSTGKPKGVMLQHDGLVNLAIGQQQRFEVDNQSRMLQFASFSFDAATAEWSVALTAGATLCLVSQEVVQSAELLTQAVNQQNISHITLPPALLAVLNRDEWHAVSHLVIAGDHCPLPLAQAWSFGRRLINAYGPSEVTVCASCGDVSADSTQLTIGTALPGKSLYVLDSDLQLVPPGVIGELYVSGAGVARGYLNRPDLTVERFIQSPFDSTITLYRTGDLVRWLPDGGLEFQGRVDHQVKLRGFRIELEEVTAALLKQSGVSEAYVMVREDQAGDKRLVAYWVSAGDAMDERRADDEAMAILRQSLKQLLPGYMVPSAFVQLDSLPLNPNGKVDRKQLPEPNYDCMSNNYQAPQTAAEVALCEVWQKVLGISQVGVNDNFFALGGDSILAIQVASQAKQAGYQLATRQLFEHQTVAELALYVEAVTSTISQLPVKGEQPLLPIQQRFLTGDQTDLHHFNQAQWLTIPYAVNESALRQLLAALYQRHDVMRLAFVQQEGQWQGHYLDDHQDRIAASLWIEDCRHLHGNALADHIASLAEKAQASLSLGNEGTLCRWIWCQLPEGQSDQLLWVMHHLIVDGVSWRVLIQDWEQGLAQLHQQQVVSLSAKTHSYQQWGQLLHENCTANLLASERDCWLSILQAPVMSLLPSGQPAVASQPVAQTVRIKLDKTLTKQLLGKANQCYHTQINDLLLTALLEAFAADQATPAIRIDLEGHGREPDLVGLTNELDISQTVGWFTSLYPVLLTKPNEADLGAQNWADTIKAVKEQLRAVPNKGLGFGLLRYIAQDPDIVLSHAISDVVFNYLGQFSTGSDQLTIDVAESDDITAFSYLGKEESAARSKQHLLEITGIAVNGELEFNFEFDSQVLPVANIERLANAYQVCLTQLVDHCLNSEGGHTPSDFTLLSLTREQVQFFDRNYPQLVDLYPTTPMQQGLLLHSALDASSGVYLCQQQMVFEPLNAECFKSAWSQLVERHAILRTGFAEMESGELIQVVFEQVEMPWQEFDWRHLSKEQYARQLEELAIKERTTPFVFDCPPLMRFALVQETEQRYRFLWTNHHALLDGWCLPRLFGELMTCYQVLCSGSKANLPSIAPYRNYIRWLKQQDYKAAENYWKGYLKGFSSTSILNFGESSEVFVEGAQFEKSFSLSKDQTSKLKKLAKYQQVTLNTVIQSAWAILLSRYCGANDIVFGSTRSGRPDSLVNADEMMGLFINSLPVRLQLNDDMTLTECLEQLQQGQAAHDKYGYMSLVDIQKWCDVSSGQALFESIMVFENYPIDASLSDSSDLSEPMLVEEVTSVEQTNYPLSLLVIPEEQITFQVSYQPTRFTEQIISNLVMHLNNLLVAMTSVDSDCLISQLEILTDAEIHQQLYRFNQTDVSFPHEVCIHQLFEAQAIKSPDATAIVFEGQRLSYKELNLKANQLANFLVKRGVKPNALVGLCVERSIEMIIGVLGILKAGGAYLPLSADYPEDRLKFMLEDSQPLLLLTQYSLQKERPYFKGFSFCLDSEWESINHFSGENLSVPVKPVDLAYIIYTSGSTGKPKGVMLEHKGLVNLAFTQRKAFSVTENSRILQFATFSFDAATWEWCMALTSGAALYLLTKDTIQSGEKLSKDVEALKITHATLPPAILSALDIERWKGVAHLIVAGESCSLSLAQKWAKGRQFYNAYGPTETTVCATIFSFSADENQLPIGYPISNTQAYVLNSDQNLLPVGIVGELYIGGINVARGYLNRPELTAEKFVCNPFSCGQNEFLYRTGDLVRWLPDGTLEFIGRADNQVKIRGFRIELGEIENTLLEYADVENALVIDKDRLADQTGGKQLVAYIETKSPQKEINKEIKVYLNKQLPGHMVPDVIMTVSEFPLTPNGKIDRKALPDPVYIHQEEYVSPVNETEQAIVGLWQQLLVIDEPISTTTNFFDIGGNSLMVMRLNAMVKARFGVNLAIGAVFEQPTIGQLSRLLDQQLNAEDDELLSDILDQIDDLAIDELAQLLETSEE
ncbi:non-ribosomal peptide synthase/polyketide synthase, partial [Zooshikella marina]|nr:non-ribosomal peptide synthase/polyketide synthase [Zooshikella ganghwensis]